MFLCPQDNQRISVKALSESLSTMQDKTASYQNQITNINERLINISTMPAVTMRKYNSEVSSHATILYKNEQIK